MTTCENNREARRRASRIYYNVGAVRHSLCEFCQNNREPLRHRQGRYCEYCENNREARRRASQRRYYQNNRDVLQERHRRYIESLRENYDRIMNTNQNNENNSN